VVPKRGARACVTGRDFLDLGSLCMLMASIFSAKAGIEEWVSRPEGHERWAKFEGVHASGGDVFSGAGR
jgi:hypothetical protein